MEQEMQQIPNVTEKQQQQANPGCNQKVNNCYQKNPQQTIPQSIKGGMSRASQRANFQENTLKKFNRCEHANAICQHSITIRRMAHVDYSNLHPPEAHMKLCPIETHSSRQMPILVILDNEQPHMPLFVRGEQLNEVLAQGEYKRAEYEKKKWFYVHPVQGSFKPKENYCLVCERTYPCAYSDVTANAHHSQKLSLLMILDCFKQNQQHVKDYEHVYKYYMNPLTEMITGMAISMGRSNAIEAQLKKREILRKLKETYQKNLLRSKILESLRQINNKENSNAEVVINKRRIRMANEDKENRRSVYDGDFEVLDGFSESSESIKLKIQQIQAELDNNKRRSQGISCEDIEQYEYEQQQQKLKDNLSSFSSPELNNIDCQKENHQDYQIEEKKILLHQRLPKNNPENHSFDGQDNQLKLLVKSISVQGNNSQRFSIPEQTYALDMIPTEQDEEIQQGTILPAIQINSSSFKEQDQEDDEEAGAEIEFLENNNKDNSNDQIKQAQKFQDLIHSNQLNVNENDAIVELKLIDNSLNQLNRNTIKNSPKDLRINRFETNKIIQSIKDTNPNNLSVNYPYQSKLPIDQHSPGPIPSKQKNSHILTSHKKLCNFSTMADDSYHQSLMGLSGQAHRNIYRALNFNQNNSKEKSDCKRGEQEIGMVTLEDEIGIENIKYNSTVPFSKPTTAPRITVEKGKKLGKDTSSRHKNTTSSMVTTGQIITEDTQKKKQTDKIQGQLEQLTQQARSTSCIKFNFDDLSEIVARNPDKIFQHFHVNHQDDNNKLKLASQDQVINLNSPRVKENIDGSKVICKKGFKNKKRTYDQFANSNNTNNRILKENNIEENNNSNAETEEDYFDDEINISKRFKLFGILTTEFKSYWNHSWQFLVSHMPQIFVNKKTTKQSQKEQRQGL